MSKSPIVKMFRVFSPIAVASVFIVGYVKQSEAEARGEEAHYIMLLLLLSCAFICVIIGYRPFSSFEDPLYPDDK